MTTLFQRKSIRLKDYDYSEPGVYFVTICTKDRECLFGEVLNRQTQLNKLGIIAQEAWNELSIRFSGVETDEYIVMPNHVHGIVMIHDPDVGAQFIAPHSDQGAINRAPTLGEIIRTFKALTACRIRLSHLQNFKWQRNYYEHIIRNENELFETCRYMKKKKKKKGGSSLNL